AIVLLHGLNRISSDFQIMKKRLEEAFPTAKIIALESVNKDPNKKSLIDPALSVSLSIEDQAAKAYQEIKEKLGNNKQLVIIGHSQGGLRGFALAKNHAHNLHKEAKIGIQKLITIGTPWKGAPVMQHIYNQTQTKNHLDGLASTLDKISEGFTEDIKNYILRVPKPIKGLSEKFPFLYNYLGNKLMHRNMLGIVDLKPDSNFIQHYVTKGLKQFTIPVSAIAGVLTDFSQIFDPFPSHISKNELQRLNTTYAILIGGSSDCEHDMLLPVDTQHAIGVEKNNFECIKIIGACHGNKVGMRVKKGVAELHHEAVIKQVIALVTATFYKEEIEAVAA
ncbi:MAG: hypothetical protein K2X94_04835, partial [Amoebophilaceae bacterium]|nr:hypothetical protein [Amoebophilaceae bacterium]